MSTWSAQTQIAAAPDAVLGALTDRALCLSWAPVPVTLSELDGDQLVPGSTARVSGRLLRRELSFAIEVQAADAELVSLRADGPFSLQAEYTMQRAPGGCDLRATVRLHEGRGLGGRLLASASRALLDAGLLQRAVQRIADAAEGRALAPA
jgi:hypothetical protein